MIKIEKRIIIIIASIAVIAVVVSALIVLVIQNENPRYSVMQENMALQIGMKRKALLFYVHMSMERARCLITVRNLVNCSHLEALKDSSVSCNGPVKSCAKNCEGSIAKVTSALLDGSATIANMPRLILHTEASTKHIKKGQYILTV